MDRVCYDDVFSALVADLALNFSDDQNVTGPVDLVEKAAFAPLVRRLAVQTCSRFGLDVTSRSLLSERMPNLVRLQIHGCTIPAFTVSLIVLPRRLQHLSLTSCQLRDFEVHLPPDIMEVNLENNRLSVVPACFDALRHRSLFRGPGELPLVLRLELNDYWWDKHPESLADLPRAMVTDAMLLELTRANFHGLCSVARTFSMLRLLRGVDGERPIVTAPQNVHLRSVEHSTVEAVARVMATPGAPNPDYLAEFCRRILCIGCRHYGPCTAAGACQEAVRAVTAECTGVHFPHPTLRVTYGALCERLVALLVAQPEAVCEQVFAVIRQEVVASKDVCLTGKFTHLLASLNGLVDGFNIGISRNEAISDALVMVRKKWTALEGEEYLTNAVPEALQALEDACVPEEEQAAWIDAL